MQEIFSIANKEFKSFFASPAAYLFLGAFVGTTLFVFFWVETFFARNIADIRPLFQWLPLLLIFLVAALTMRSWSEERRSGTLESLLTSPVSSTSLILGKFFAALGLVVLALTLTLPLPITTSFLGQIDWGPVVGGYVATFFLAASYISIGIYTSGKTDNPIVALIMTAVVCGAFYIVGAQLLTNLFSHEIATILNKFGTGTRFESITRGVIDLRDLIYYMTIVLVFLTLNFFSLEKLRWDGKKGNKLHQKWSVVIWLFIVNCIFINIWLSPVSLFRLDITQDGLYSLSDTTKDQLKELREPLVIRGYFSERSHPLLTPLVPKVKDLLSEYEMASNGKVRTEFIDPQKNRELEEEAASKYSIKPVPFQTATRHQAEVVNSYFDIVVAYGDQFEVLSYADLIEAKASVSQSGVDVRLKNPEYAVTRAIRKVVGSFRIGGSPIEVIKDPINLSLYISSDTDLPEGLIPVKNDLVSIAKQYEDISKGKFSYKIKDPSIDSSLVEMLETEYNVKSQVGNLLDPKPFWFSVFVEAGDNIQQVQFSESLEKDALKKAVETSLKRLAPGYLRTVALMTPPASTVQNFNRLKQVLAENLKVSENDLTEGKVPEDSDMLLVLAPTKVNDLQLKAIDQFLMRGGSVVIATSPFNVQIGQSITAKNHQSGLESWLENLGYEIEPAMVLDPQSTSLPVPVQRYIGGIPIREIQLVPYPHFPDIRSDGISDKHPITSSLDQITLNWASPILVNEEIVSSDKYTPLFTSSSSSWTSEDLEVIPDFETYPDTGFSIDGDRESKLLAIAAKGPFNSYFKDVDLSDSVESNLLKSSPASSRLVLIASNSFAADGAIDISSHALSTLYTKSLEFVQNSTEWALEDQGLSSLRGRSQFARTLLPMSENEQQRWESANYFLALFGLLLVWFWRKRSFKSDQLKYKSILSKI